MKSRADLKGVDCCIIKIGSAVLTDNGRGLNRAAINKWVEQISELKSRGVNVVIVSSGSVAEGMVRLGWNSRPHALSLLDGFIGACCIDERRRCVAEHCNKGAWVVGRVPPST